MKTGRGVFILLEGLDRSGKSTQCELLKAKLEKEYGRTELRKFPDRTTAIGKMIDAYLSNTDYSISDEAIHLLFSANRWELAQDLIQTLNSGVNLVVDRYIYSGIAFTAAKHKPSINLEWCRCPDVGLPKPDVTVFLNVSESVAKQRGDYGEERYEKVEFQKKVKEMFLKLMTSDWKVVSGDKCKEDVAQEIWQAVKEAIDGGIDQKIAIFK